MPTDKEYRDLVKTVVRLINIVDEISKTNEEYQKSYQNVCSRLSAIERRLPALEAGVRKLYVRKYK